jgi:hypothetical protein
MIQEPDNPEGFEEVHSKVIDTIYEILDNNQDIKKWYKLLKARNAVVCEPPTRETVMSLEATIAVVSEFELLRQKYPVDITKHEYSNNYTIIVDKVKYRKFIIDKLIK